ncbi:MAG: hypothetical protein HC862_13180 [Scytonema sp. RU_4_4]|nr:hypothetical protein [Scytonema sp. RU_4_4]
MQIKCGTAYHPTRIDQQHHLFMEKRNPFLAKIPTDFIRGDFLPSSLKVQQLNS